MNYRSDMLVRLLQTLDRRSQQDEGYLYDENTIQDVFFPMLEQLSLIEEIEVITFSAPFVWGDGITVESNWLWDRGGTWL